jgi:hypothetical protein
MFHNNEIDDTDASFFVTEVLAEGRGYAVYAEGEYQQIAVGQRLTAPKTDLFPRGCQSANKAPTRRLSLSLEQKETRLSGAVLSAANLSLPVTLPTKSSAKGSLFLDESDDDLRLVAAAFVISQFSVVESQAHMPTIGSVTIPPTVTATGVGAIDTATGLGATNVGAAGLGAIDTATGLGATDTATGLGVTNVGAAGLGASNVGAAGPNRKRLPQLKSEELEELKLSCAKMQGNLESLAKLFESYIAGNTKDATAQNDSVAFPTRIASTEELCKNFPDPYKAYDAKYPFSDLQSFFLYIKLAFFRHGASTRYSFVSVCFIRKICC